VSGWPATIKRATNHDRHEVLALCDEVLELWQGRVTKRTRATAEDWPMMNIEL